MNETALEAECPEHTRVNNDNATLQTITEYQQLQTAKKSTVAKYARINAQVIAVVEMFKLFTRVIDIETLYTYMCVKKNPKSRISRASECHYDSKMNNLLSDHKSSGNYIFNVVYCIYTSQCASHSKISIFKAVDNLRGPILHWLHQLQALTVLTSVRRRGKNVDSSKSNPLRRRGNNYDASTWRRRRRRRKKMKKVDELSTKNSWFTYSVYCDPEEAAVDTTS